MLLGFMAAISSVFCLDGKFSLSTVTPAIKELTSEDEIRKSHGHRHVILVLTTITTDRRRVVHLGMMVSESSSFAAAEKSAEIEIELLNPETTVSMKFLLGIDLNSLENRYVRMFYRVEPETEEHFGWTYQYRSGEFHISTSTTKSDSWFKRHWPLVFVTATLVLGLLGVGYYAYCKNN